MKRYKEIENNIEYDVFEFDETEKDYQARIIEELPYSKIVRDYNTYKDVFYFKKGQAHNDYGPTSIFFIYSLLEYKVMNNRSNKK